MGLDCAAVTPPESTEGQSGSDPMVVVYRLSGLDGEATEAVVNKLTCSTATDSLDCREKEAFTELLKCNDKGLPLLVNILVTWDASLSKQLVPTPFSNLLQLLLRSCEVHECRLQLIKCGALVAMLRLVRCVLSSKLESESGTSHKNTLRSQTAVLRSVKNDGMEELDKGYTVPELLMLLKTLEQLAAEADKNTDEDHYLGSLEDQVSNFAPQHVAGHEDRNTASEVKQLADGIAWLNKQGMEECATVLARILFCIAHKDIQAQAGLLDHFMPALELTLLDSQPEQAAMDQQSQLTSLIHLIEAITDNNHMSSSQGHALRVLALERHVTVNLIDYLLSLFLEQTTTTAPVIKGEKYASPKAGTEKVPSVTSVKVQRRQVDFEVSRLELGEIERHSAMAHVRESSATEQGRRLWDKALAKKGVPFALQILTALAKGHAKTAHAIISRPYILELLHHLEGTQGGSTLAPLAEHLLNALVAAGDLDATSRVTELRNITRQQMQEKAAKKRAALLKSMGMVQVNTRVKY